MRVRKNEERFLNEDGSKAEEQKPYPVQVILSMVEML